MKTTTTDLRAFALAQQQRMNDPHGDGTGNDAVPPTGDDWNDLFDQVMAATESLTDTGGAQ